MRGVWRTSIVVLALVHGLAAQGSGNRTPVVREGTVARDRPVDVALRLHAGDVLHVRVQQRELDLSLSLLDAVGRELQDGDVFSGNFVQGHVEQLIAAVPNDGGYVLRLRASGTSPTATFRLTAATVPAAPRGAALADGFRLLADGVRLQRQADMKGAITALEAAADRLASAGAPDLEAKALQVAGGVRFLSGDPPGARVVLERSLPIARRAGPIHESDALEVLGRVHLVGNDVQQALDLSRQAVELSRRLGFPVHLATKVNTLALIYREAGQPQRALAYVLPAIDALDDRHAGPRALLQITAGNIYNRMGDATAALALLESASDWYRRAGDRRFEAIALSGMGTAYLTLDRNAEAMTALDASSRLDRELGNTVGLAYDATNAAVARRRLGRLDEAATLLSDALEVGRAAGDRPLELSVLVQMAMLARQRGELDHALARVEAAVALGLASRDGLRSPAARAGFLSSRAEYLELRTDVLMDLHAKHPDGGFAARALAAINDMKARGLVEMVADPAPRVATAREGELEAEINRLARDRASLRTSNQAEAARLGARLTERLVELETVREPLDRPRLLPGRGEFDVAGVRGLLDADSALLQYGYGQERIYGWIVTPSGFESFTVGERRPFEERTRRAYRLLAARAEETRGETPGQRKQRLDAADRELDSLLTSLSGDLIGPIRDAIAGMRVAVVAEGALQYLPFPLLIATGDSSAGESGPEVVHLPSVAVLKALRTRRGTRPTSARGVAVFADPVFSARDARVRGRQAAPPEPSMQDVTRAAEDAGIADLGRLRFSRREAEAIAGVTRPGDMVTSLDFSASVPRLREAAGAGHRILHLATHGLVNHVHPELSGLVFSLVDPTGRPQEGFLRLHEIYGLRLDTELVTLSACRTAFGRELRGEGLAGLSQGFLAAGASRVLASLWDVDDRATAELMTRFYRALLVDGRSAADALRHAQLSMRRDPRWRSPFYWAGFVLQGDWR